MREENSGEILRLSGNNLKSTDKYKQEKKIVHFRNFVMNHSKTSSSSIFFLIKPSNLFESLIVSNFITTILFFYYKTLFSDNTTKSNTNFSRNEPTTFNGDLHQYVTPIQQISLHYLYCFNAD